MTAITKRYRLRIYETDDTTVAYTYTTTIAGAVTAGGQTVRPLDCTTETTPWIVEVVDASEVFSATLGDTAGRSQLLLRLASISVSTDGSAYAVIATGRLSEIADTAQSAYRLSVSDERVIERQTQIFTGADTTRAWPPGFMSGQFGPLVEQVKGSTGWWWDTSSRTAPITSILVTPTLAVDDVPPSLRAAVESDLKPGLAPKTQPADVAGGSFETLRCSIYDEYAGPADWDQYEIVSFARLASAGLITGGPAAGLEWDGLRWLHLYDPDDTVPASGSMALSFPGLEPTDDIPQHVDDIHPIELLEAIYDGAYQSADTPQTVRYDSTAMTALKNDPRFGTVRFREKRPATMSAWLNANIFGPFRVVPLVGTDGRIVPTYMGNATEADVGTPSALFEFNATNSRAPSWRNTTADQVTALTVTYPRDRQYHRTALRDGTESALDNLHVESNEITREHDRIADGYQRREYAITGDGTRSAEAAWGQAFTGESEARTDQLALDVFSRFGDGPIYATIHGLSATSGVEPGDYVRSAHDTFPNPSLGARGGERILQVLSRQTMPDGYLFECMELGPYSVVLTPPTLTATQHGGGPGAVTAWPEHIIRLTFTGFPAGGGWELWMARTDIAIEPSVNDPRWRYVSGGTQTEVNITMLHSGKRYYFRARSIMQGRIASDWSAAVTAITSSYSSPTALAASQITATTALVTWTQQYDHLDIEISVDGTVVQTLLAGAEQVRLVGLTASTDHDVTIVYLDMFGGRSTGGSTLVVTTTATATQLTPPERLAVTIGTDITTRTSR